MILFMRYRLHKGRLSQGNNWPLVFDICLFGASTLVRAAMDSDDEIFLTQNTFSQESFSPELNLEELVGDFRKQCILPHSTTEIQVYG